MLTRNLASGCLVALAIACAPAWPALAAPPAAAESSRQPWGEPQAAAARRVAAFFTSPPSDEALQATFEPSFLAAVPPAQLRAIFAQLGAQGGAATVEGPLAQGEGSPTHARYLLRFAKGLEAKLDLVITPQPPHRLSGLLVGALTPSLTSWKALEAAMAQLPGRAGLAVWRLPDPAQNARVAPTALASLRPDEAFAIGSSFKLAILHALVADVAAKRRNWEDVLHLQSAFASLPSGRLQAWPDETPLTLATLAGQMISESDNTATDLLLRALSRGRLEREVKGPLAWRHAALNVPFLSTREMFLLKDERTPQLLQRYLVANAAERLALLEGPIAQAELEGLRFATEGKPVAIDRVEWFASPADLAGTLHRLARSTREGDLGRGLLAINPALQVDPKRWPYVGYKGGSEPGVLNMSWLLKREDGAWFAMSLSWNRLDAAVDTAQLLGLGQAALGLLDAER